MTAKILAVLLLFALPIQAKTLIEAAYEAGELDLETALIYQVLSVRAPDQLPAIYRESGGLAVCGTPYLVQAMSAAPRPERRLPSALGQAGARAGRTSNIIILSPSGRFRVHYDTEGTPRSMRLRTTTPTASRTTSTSLWSSSTAFGYPRNRSTRLQSASFGQRLGRRRRIRCVYVIELDGGYYGYAYPASTPVRDHHATAISKSTTTLPTQATSKPSGLDALRVTIAHEFHHAIQFGYYAKFDGSWWQESTSTWMEEVAYPHIDDYLQYLTYFLSEPQRALNSGKYGSLHTYGSSIFSHFLDQHYGSDLESLIREELQQHSLRCQRSTGTDAAQPLDLGRTGPAQKRPSRSLRPRHPPSRAGGTRRHSWANSPCGTISPTTATDGEYYAEGDKYPVRSHSRHRRRRRCRNHRPRHQPSRCHWQRLSAP